MFGFVKMAAVSALLSYGVVTVYEPAPAVSGSAKVYHDRLVQSDEAPAKAPAQAAADMMVRTTGSVASLPVASGKSDRLVMAPACASQTWPHLSQECVVQDAGSGQQKRVRVIAIENRVGPNTSVLAKAPATGVAQR